MNDINVIENNLLLAYMCKRVAAHYKVNKTKDQLAQSIALLLEAEAKSLEVEAINQTKKC